MRILLVDDDFTLRRTLKRRLSALAADMTVHEAGGVEEARGLLALHGYDAVVSDEHMPDGLGHLLLATMAKEQPSCRRALMSGNPPPDAPSAWETFFEKPNGLDALVAWVQALTPSEH
ncbi:MAG: response regulator [Labilithrix sp.]|nr:response regulator [Labilithrix sp.]MCW5812633.1 response regulator [Labilithrix sp.]